MTSLKLFGSYNICARFAPGFLFLLCAYLLKGCDIANLDTNSILYISIVVILSAVLGFISSSIIKILERCIWKCCGNPMISHLKKYNNELYENLLEEYKTDENIKIQILKNTRDDSKLFWKNVSYGFFRNSILLSVMCLYFSYFTNYFCHNLIVCLFVIFMTYISSDYYAEQAIESYREKTSKC
ncbi:hypothetical protein CCY99_09250 [Helicobacter sp. 16-1353]|uniref:hypothetical protein n=1 Tax=Helicobacter sp. 16-1353 TaxID=2004996 RepID=UPI000DCDD1A5|nr:hypothetical protein [Helicobacter sp. 16-1353]RAX51355.1 hypothetical protein CCY99_09250 [Helicobacter sp. 16-1353]